jgi:hypothetical protein
MHAQTKPSPYVTILTAAEMSKEAGFANMTQGWWKNCINNGTINVKSGVVPYLSREDVEIVITTVMESGVYKPKTAEG